MEITRRKTSDRANMPDLFTFRKQIKKLFHNFRKFKARKRKIAQNTSKHRGPTIVRGGPTIVPNKYNNKYITTTADPHISVDKIRLKMFKDIFSSIPITDMNHEFKKFKAAYSNKDFTEGFWKARWIDWNASYERYVN